MSEIQITHTMKHIVIIGGGTGGIMVATQLLKKGQKNITVIEPSLNHFYQPAWTLVGANDYNFEDTKKPMSELMPDDVNWLKHYVEKIDADNNRLTLDNGESVDYDYLVASPGIKIDTSLVEGLQEALNNKVVCSNYINPEETWRQVSSFKGGTALFTQPATPIKCGGAPQKAMYMSDDYFRKSGVRDNTNIVFATNGGVIFGVKPIKETLMKVVDRKDLSLKFGHNLVKIDADSKIAWYKLGDNVGEHNHKDIETVEKSGLVGIKFDFCHLAPPQTAPDIIKNSALANDAGWMDVDKYTMQSTKFNNVFGVGDCTSAPTAKTGAAIRKQVPVVVQNLLGEINGNGLGPKKYNGYSSCPLVTGYGKMVLAEFDYDSNFIPDPKLKRMLIFDSSKESKRLYWLKKKMLPWLYWNKMMKGQDV